MAELKGNTLVQGDLRVKGNLFVTGSIVQEEIRDLKIKDRLIELASGALSKEALDGGGIQFGDKNLDVHITYHYGDDKLIIHPHISGSIDSASHAKEIQWKKISNVPLHLSLSFVSGVFTSSIYRPTASVYSSDPASERNNKDIQIKIPAYASHVGAVDTGSFTQYSASVSASFSAYTHSISASFSEYSASISSSTAAYTHSVSASFALYSSSTAASFSRYSASVSASFSAYSASVSSSTAAYTHSVSASFSAYSASVSASFSAYSASVSSSFSAYSASVSKSFAAFSSSVNSRINTLSSSVGNISSSVNSRLVYLESASTSNSLAIATKMTTASFNSWMSGSNSKFNGTASYASEGPYLHITGGVVTGSVTFEKSFAQGYRNNTTGVGSHAEGSETTAQGEWSHAEGAGTLAEGNYSHAEGKETKATGIYSHAGGQNTEAIGAYQTVVGRYNKTGDQYAFIVGVGTGSHISESIDVPETHENGLAVRWDGDIEMAPGRILHGTSSHTLQSIASEQATVLRKGPCRIEIDEVNKELLFIIDE